jgi:uncharacterized protein YjdB
MRYRPLLGVLAMGVLSMPLVSCINSPSLTSITISPTTMDFGGAGLTAQLTATGYYTHPDHAAETKDITSQVSWASSASECVTVSSSGLITSGSDSCSNILITASAPGYNGLISANMTVNVTQPTTGGTGPTGAGDVVTITIIPGAQSVPVVGDTAQFLAIGTTSTGVTVNLSGRVSWTSSSPQIASIGATTGLATALGQGTSTITALYTNADGAAATGTSSFSVVSGVSEPFTAISIIPNAQSVSASGQSANFIALGTSGTTGLIEDVTESSNVIWSSSIPSVATVTSGQTMGNGLVTGVSEGTSTITAQLTNPGNPSTVLTAQATVNVTLTAAPEPLLSLTIIPPSITVGNLQDTGNFLAVGTFSQPPYVRDLTNSVTWISSAPQVFPVITANDATANPGTPAGTVTAFGDGSATIIAEATDPTTKSIQTATATFTCPVPTVPLQPGECYEGSQATGLLATITIYNEGANTTDWEVTAPSATGTADVIHCGPGWTGTGGSVCVATYPIDTVTPSGNPGVVLTAQGGAFGGWSYNCTPSDAEGNTVAGFTAAGPNYCVVSLTETVFDQLTQQNVTISGVDQTVGAIFN